MSLLKLLQFVIVPFVLVTAVTGCGGGNGLANVSGKVTVDGQIPAAGSSITFFPSDGKPPAGDTLKDGNYNVNVATGESKVEIRVPRIVPNLNPTVRKQGPGAEDAAAGTITESLPPKYNDQSELKLNVVGGKNQKDWEVSTKP